MSGSGIFCAAAVIFDSYGGISLFILLFQNKEYLSHAPSSQEGCGCTELYSGTLVVPGDRRPLCGGIVFAVLCNLSACHSFGIHAKVILKDFTCHVVLCICDE